MAHMIDTSNGTAAIAFVGRTPWHGLGQSLTPGATIDEWTREAGLAYTVLESPVLFRHPSATYPEVFNGRKVLHRSDNGTPLAVVSDGYRVVQPSLWPQGVGLGIGGRRRGRGARRYSQALFIAWHVI